MHFYIDKRTDDGWSSERWRESLGPIWAVAKRIIYINERKLLSVEVPTCVFEGVQSVVYRISKKIKIKTSWSKVISTPVINRFWNLRFDILS
jgi:hypothetical protein